MEWEQRNFRIPYRLGFIKLSDAQVKSIIPKDHFSRFPDNLSNHPPVELKSTAADAAYIATCPIQGDEPTVSMVRGYVRYIWSRYPHYTVDTSGDYEQYMHDRFPGKRRRKLKNMVRRFEKRANGGAFRKLYRTPEEVSEFYDLAQEVARHTYQAKFLGGCLPVDNPAFKRRLCDMAQRGQVRGYLLFDGEKPVAYACFEEPQKGVLVYEYCGHLPDHDEGSPGTALLLLAIQDAFEDPDVVVMDLSEGDGLHKRRFATSQQVCGDVFFFKRRPYNGMVVASHVAFSTAARSAVGVLDKYRLKERVKRLVKHA